MELSVVAQAGSARFASIIRCCTKQCCTNDLNINTCKLDQAMPLSARPSSIVSAVTILEVKI